jgi:type I restriction enzyme, S subunit
MGHGRWVDGEFAYVTPEKADSLASNCAKPGDLVFTQRGTLGQVALVPKKGADRYLVSQSQMKVTLDPSKADALFLYYVFTSSEQQAYIVQNAITTGVPHTNLGILRNTPLALPPLPKQKAIAAVLGALDDKIELNQRMNATLEAMARALFQSWFVDFDPVRAKLDGRPPGALDSATAALFPEHLEDSSLGHIPKGWKVGKIQDCCAQIQNGGTPRRNEPRFWDGGNIPWLASGEVRQSIITATGSFITEEGLVESSAKWVPEFSTVVALYGATAGQVSFTSCRLTTNQAVCALIPKKSFTFFNYLTMRSATAEMENKAVGSAQQNISKGIVEETRVILPPTALVERFGDVAGPLFERWISNLRQSRTLATTRDTLLPRLLSGELDVSKIAVDNIQ